MSRVLVIAAVLALGVSPWASLHADATARPEAGSAIVWRLSTDGDWLLGLRTDTAPVPPAPLRRTSRWPSFSETDSNQIRPARPSLVLRLDALAAADGSDFRACGLPLWLSLGDTGLCPRWSSTDVAGLSGSLHWLDAETRVGIRVDTWKAPMPASGARAVAAPLAAGRWTEWPLVVGGSSAGRLAVERIGVDGQIRLGADLGLRWAAGVATVETVGPAAGPDPGFDQQSLTLGLWRGAWSGGLTGRLTRPRPAADPFADTGALDIEVAWTTPWEGELSFGAENLIVREPEFRPAAPTAKPPQPSARTPFVRYRQDF